MKYCEKCRAQLPDDARFCDNCGNNLLEKTSAKYSGKINAQVTAIHVNKKKLFPIVALLALVVIAFIAINIFKYMRTYPSKLEGIYVAEQMSQGGRSVYHIMNFGKDGSVIYTSQPKERTEDTYALYTSLSDETRHAGTYTAKKKKLTLNLDNGMTVYDYQMTDNGLELTDLKGETRIYLDATDGILGQTGMNTEDPAGIQEPTDINNAQLPEYTGIDRAYILPDSNTRYLSTSELQGFSAYELRIARNEIYARHGRMFTDPALNSYFRGKTWYVPAVDADKFNDNVLTDVEKTNLETIKKVETSKQ